MISGGVSNFGAKTAKSAKSCQDRAFIISLSKDSFFLYEVLNEMRAQYRFGFIDETDMRALSNLIKKCLAKHNLGVKNPSPGQIRQIPSSCLPIRDDDSDVLH